MNESNVAAASATVPESASGAPDALPPHAQVVQMACGHIITRALYAFAELGIADLLTHGPQSAEQLGAATGTKPDSLSRLLRLMAGLGYVSSDGEGRFTLQPLGEALRSDSPGHARSMLRLIAGPVGWATLSELLHSVKTGEPAADRALGLPMFDYLATAPQEAQWFNEMMIAFHGSEPPAVAAAYDFSGCHTIVDVGGGTGNLLTTILLAHPHLRGVLYDVPHVAAQARTLIDSRNLADRCTVTDGSFFDAVPKGGDTYLLSHIIHDWDEARPRHPRPHPTRHAIRRPVAGHRNGDPTGQRVPPRQADRHRHARLHAGRPRTHGGRVRGPVRQGRLEADRVVPTQSPVSVIEAVHG